MRTFIFKHSYKYGKMMEKDRIRKSSGTGLCVDNMIKEK